MAEGGVFFAHARDEWNNLSSASIVIVEQPRAVLFNPRVRKGLTTDS